MSDYIVTKLRLDPDGIWRARVTLRGSGTAVDVERRGGWRALVRPAPRVHRRVLRDVLPAVAAELQARLPAAERKVKR